MRSKCVEASITTFFYVMSEVNSIVILIGGGHAAGKRTTAHLLRDEISNTLGDCNLDTKVIDLNEYTDESEKYTCSQSKSAAITVGTGPGIKLKPSRFNFDRLKQDMKKDLVTAPGEPQKVIIIHGLYALYDKELRDLSQIRVFIISDPDIRLIRWIRRDVLDPSKNVSLELVINSYLQGAREEMSNFIFPTKEFADVIMPRGAEMNAVRLIIDGILPFIASGLHAPDKITYSSNLRPSDDFLKEKFDDQKGKFYELN